MRLKSRLYWLIPAIILLVAIGLLFSENFKNVTEVPDEDWSRALPIGSTNINKYPFISKTEDGAIEIVEFDDQILVKKTYGSQYNVIDEENFPDIPFNKWTKVFSKGNDLVYFQYKTIYDGTTKKEITNADSFHPLRDALIYLKNNVVYQLNLKTKTSEILYTIEGEFDELVTYQAETEELVFLTYAKNQDKLDVSVYKHSDNLTTTIHKQKFSISRSERVQDAALAYKDNHLAFVFKTERKGAGGSVPVNNVYLFENENKPKLNKITFNDPKGANELRNISDLSLAFENENVKILFSAKGKSKTKYQGTTAFNIYEAVVNEEDYKIYRRSNTSDYSAKPQWINNDTISWIDFQSEANDILLSSSDQALIGLTKQYTGTEYIKALGKTIGMGSVAIFAILISSMWFIWPLLLITIIYMSKRNLLDRDPTWVYYVGLISYAVAVLLFKHRFFIDTIDIKAPGYLTFQNSDLVFLLILGILAHLCASIGATQNEWNVPVRLLYFMGVHITMLAFFFGPYLI
ncbi:hypothetical protein [Aquibacillus saliphilus]|uniref:hypothetical protein n=1 Tax=Aquibacillus saliphilus TaxID=1909422 RepID=UPI001CF0B872|nr:hypothetical protein [Aquibacillus saliphilus]